MKVSELLKRAKSLPRTSGVSARDRTGKQVASDSVDAVSFCASGAISNACANNYSIRSDAAEFLRIASRKLSGQASFVQVNDNNPELMNLVWDRAIKLAEAQEDK